MSCSQVTGLLMSSLAALAALLRYQSSWVLAQNGTATSEPFHFDASIAALTVSLVKPATMFRGTGARNPASANSATNTGSMLMRSMPESLAASRRSSCWRWSLALLGSSCTRMAYLPPAASVHSLAICACPFLAGSEPPPSGLMYHVSVGVAPAELWLLPQAASPGPTVTPTARTAATAVRLRMLAPLDREATRPRRGEPVLRAQRPRDEARGARSEPRRGTRCTPVAAS